jgi:murein DD-endopeptidase MepM/ murein hydrolase activator NlpD
LPGTGFPPRLQQRAARGEEKHLNIILVSSATARARTITLDWRHFAIASFGLLVVFLGFTLLFNFVALRYAAATQHPWLQAIVLADQRQEAVRTEELVQGHLTAMAIRLGELQAQMLRLDGLGERLASIAGLKPQDLPSLRSREVPGRGGAESTMPSRPLSVPEFTDLLEGLSRQVDERTDQLGVLEALLVQSSANRKFMPTLAPVVDGWFSSNFGYRIDPFNGQRSFHEGIDFPADSGTPIVAAASGRVVTAEWHPEYGRMIEIDHGNGLMSRYAHTSRMLVKVGDLVVRGQEVGTVGSTGRSTGPHLHFEVRLNGVPQNPARFLQSSG